MNLFIQNCPFMLKDRSIHLHGAALLSMLASATSIAAPSPTVSFGSYISHQINVDASGQNIAGDRGNEPSIAVNPLNPNNIVIGWRMFDSPPTAVKHGGFAYSFDGGNSWSNNQLAALPVQTRTDPVLDTDSQGNFYYQSLGLGGEDRTSVFKSTDGGVSWSEPVYQFNGDKNWLMIDKTGSASDGTIYSTWRRTSFPNPNPNYIPKYFIRSTDGGVTYQEPNAALPVANLGFGRIAIGPNGDVYLSGIDESFISANPLGIIRRGHYFLKSVNAKDPGQSPSFTAKKVDMGGEAMLMLSATGALPNPLGGDGDLQIAADQSSGPLAGSIYMMAHASPYDWQQGADPQNVYFVRSIDGGENWSAPIRLNDDTPNPNAFQYFPMLSVAPNSRIDAVWYDTRNGTGASPYRYSQLFYSYSWDGGVTWSPNKALTPLFNTHIPYNSINGTEVPGDKIGDYTHMISDRNGAHIAYTATFNGEQDVYYLNAFPDCNNNAVSDVVDIQQRRSGDTNSNMQPDSCENIVVIGDIDGDKDVDQLDINRVNAAKNKPASGPNDPRDLDKNGVINLLDARKQTQLCTRLRCAV